MFLKGYFILYISSYICIWAILTKCHLDYIFSKMSYPRGVDLIEENVLE